MAVFVSCLNINLATAKNHAYHFAENKIKSVDIAKAQKNTVLHNIQNKLNHHQNSSDTGIDKASIMQRKNLLINDSYAKLVREKELNPQTLSKETVYNIRKDISGQVIKILNRLWHALQKVQNYIKEQYIYSFTNLYLYASPVALVLSIVFVSLPDKIKQRSNQHEKR